MIFIYILNEFILKEQMYGQYQSSYSELSKKKVINTLYFNNNVQFYFYCIPVSKTNSGGLESFGSLIYADNFYFFF